MMHGPEKSDSPIVPAKPANKVVEAVAEPVEGRGGVDGNADEQSTVRTQSRAAVSQAQARIREAVDRNRKEKLTALLHHVSVDVLRAAFFALKRRAAPGVDAMTWDAYAEDCEARLALSPREAPQWRVSGVALPPDVHTEGRWQTAAARHCCAGRQDRPGSSGDDPDADL